MRDSSLKLYIRLRKLTTVLKGESGQNMVEYALVMGLVAFGTVAAMKSFATSIATGLASIGSHLTAYTS